MRRRKILASTPPERVRRYAILVLAQGWTSSATAQALEWGPHSNGPLLSLPKGSVDAVIPADTGAEPAAGAPSFHEGRLRRGYSPDSNADEARWARQEPTRNQCPGTKALVQQRVNHFRSGLALRSGQVKRCCRTALPSKAEALPQDLRPDSWHPANADPTFSVRLYWPATIELMAVKMGWVSSIGNRPLDV